MATDKASRQGFAAASDAIRVGKAAGGGMPRDMRLHSQQRGKRIYSADLPKPRTVHRDFASAASNA